MGWDKMRWDGMGQDRMGWDRWVKAGWDGMGWDGMGQDKIGWEETRQDGRAWDKAGWDKMGQDKGNSLWLPRYPPPYFLEGFQQAQTVTRVTRRKMPPVERMM